jgi:hypothetical protein
MSTNEIKAAPAELSQEWTKLLDLTNPGIEVLANLVERLNTLLPKMTVADIPQVTFLMNRLKVAGEIISRGLYEIEEKQT